MRRVIVHYHLFKNAGTSIDGLLERNFGTAWTTYEGEHAASRLGHDEVGAFIDANPSIKALSSHHARLPVPSIAGGSVIPLLMLRHPLDRVGSVYTFERGQGGGSRGADFASKHTFAEYVRWRLDFSRHGVINNFHALFLLNTSDDKKRPIHLGELPEALARLESLDFFGIVERFPESMDLMGRVLRQDYPAFEPAYERRNYSVERADSLEKRLNDVHADLGDSLWNELCERNQVDLELYDAAVKLFDRRHAEQLDVKRGLP